MLVLVKSAIYLGLASLTGLLIFFACSQRWITRDLRMRLVTLELFCVAIAFFCPTLTVYNVAAGLIVPIFARRREQIAPIYVFAMLTLPLPAARLAVAGTYLLSIHAVIALSIGAMLTALIRGGRFARRWTVPTTCVLIIFLVYVFPGVRASTFTNVARVVLDNGLTMLVPFYIVRRSVRSLADIRLVVIAFVAAAAALSTLAMYEAWSSWPLYRVVFSHYGVELGSDASVKMRGGLIRSAGPFAEPTSFAFQLALATLAGITGRYMFRSRQAYLIMCALLLAGMFAPQSRGAWLGLGAGYLTFQIMRGRLGAVIKSIVALAITGCVVYLGALSIPRLGSMLGMNSSGTINRDYRQSLLDRGLEEAHKHIWIGQELSTVLFNLRDLYQGEGIIDFVNTYLYVLLLSGLVGLIPFVAALFAPVVNLWAGRTRMTGEAVSLAAFVGGAMGATILMLAFTGLLARSTMSVCILLALAAAAATVLPKRRDDGDGEIRCDPEAVRGVVDSTGPMLVA